MNHPSSEDKEILKLSFSDYSHLVLKKLQELEEKILDISDQLEKLGNFYEETHKKVNFLSGNFIILSGSVGELQKGLNSLTDSMEKLNIESEKLVDITSRYNAHFEVMNQIIEVTRDLNESIARMNLEEVLARIEKSTTGEGNFDQLGLVRSLQKSFAVLIKQYSSCKIMGFHFNINTLTTINFFISFFCMIYVVALSFLIGLQFHRLYNFLFSRKLSFCDVPYILLEVSYEA